MSRRSPRATSAARLLACVPAFALACGACSWFSKSPEPAVVRPEPPIVAAEADDAQSAAAARAACSNYATAFEESPYPRDAIIRGIDQGKASVRFQVDGSKLTILVVTSSDPSFGDAAVRIIRKLECRVERPTVFEIPFEWRSRR